MIEVPLYGIASVFSSDSDEVSVRPVCAPTVSPVGTQSGTHVPTIPQPMPLQYCL